MIKYFSIILFFTLHFRGNTQIIVNEEFLENGMIIPKITCHKSTFVETDINQRITKI